MNFSPFIYAFEQENIGITGDGTLDGQAIKAGLACAWKSKYHPDEKALANMGKKEIPVEQRVFSAGPLPLRPNFIQPTCCKNVLIEGVTVTQFADVGAQSAPLHQRRGPCRDRQSHRSEHRRLRPGRLP